MLPKSFVSAEVSISQSKAIKIVYAKFVFTTPGDTHGRDSRDKSFKYSLRNISHLLLFYGLFIYIYILIYENCDIFQYKKYMQF